MRYLLPAILIFLPISLLSQIHVGLTGGFSSYYGDLNSRAFNRSKPAVGMQVHYEISDRIQLRGGFTAASIEGGDRYSGSEWLIKNRNLSFQSPLTEIHLGAEFTTFNLYNISWSPYLFGGVSVFRFNPYTYTAGQEKVYLQPLGTEGQGISGYAAPYSLTDLALPYGGGIKYNISDRWRIAAEIGLRKTFTDYIDDVSGFYAGEQELLAENGARAVELSYRGGEAGGPAAYPTKGYERGNPARKDGFYFTMLHLSYKLYTPRGRNSSRYKLRNCPPVPR